MHLSLYACIYRPVLSVIHFAADPNGTKVIKASSWLLNLQIWSLLKGSYLEIKTLWAYMDIKMYYGSLTVLGLFHNQAAEYHKPINRFILWINGKNICSEWLWISLLTSLGEVPLGFRDTGHRQEELASLPQPPSRAKSRCSALISCLTYLYSNYAVITKKKINASVLGCPISGPHVPASDHYCKRSPHQPPQLLIFSTKWCPSQYN